MDPENQLKTTALLPLFMASQAFSIITWYFTDGDINVEVNLTLLQTLGITSLEYVI